jgi:S-sulfosulfanyl-L-cysteine sulfohydrolase
MNKREFFNVLGAAAAAGFALARSPRAHAASPYERPLAFKRGDSASLLHMTDCHAQLLPSYFREPSVNLGIGPQRGKAPHLVGNALLRDAGLQPGTPEAYAFTHLDFERSAQRYGQAAEGVASGCAAARQR